LAQDGLKLAQETAELSRQSTILEAEAQRAAHESLVLARDTAELSRQSIDLQRGMEHTRRLETVSEWVMEIGDRARRVMQQQPDYLLIQAVNRLQAALSFLPQEQLPICRRLATYHNQAEMALGSYINAFAEVEKQLGQTNPIT
jgi:hypothetical protein